MARAVQNTSQPQKQHTYTSSPNENVRHHEVRCRLPRLCARGHPQGQLHDGLAGEQMLWVARLVVQPVRAPALLASASVQPCFLLMPTILHISSLSGSDQYPPYPVPLSTADQQQAVRDFLVSLCTTFSVAGAGFDVVGRRFAACPTFCRRG